MRGYTESAKPSGRSIWGITALAAAVVSLIGLAVLVLGDAANWKGFAHDETSLANSVAWNGMWYGAAAAFFLGIVALGRGAKSADTRAGAVVMACLCAVLLLGVIVA
jgi:hypothetical protein